MSRKRLGWLAGPAPRVSHPRTQTNRRGFHTPGPPWDIFAEKNAGSRLAFDFGQVGHGGASGADAVQQVEAVAADNL